MGTSPKVTHLVQDFGVRSQAWIYDLVTMPGGFEPHVICETYQAPSEFPLADVRPMLPRSRRFGGEWITRQLNTRLHLPVGPHNYWRRTLRRRPPGGEVFHAHFGPIGWMAVDAGLTPVVTSFYGYDAAAAQVLSYWGRKYPSLFSAAAAIVAEGPAMGQRLVRLGAPDARIRVLPLIAEVDTLRWQPPAPTGPIRVLMAGRFLAKKGFELGIDALAARCAAGEIELTIMGEGPEEGQLRTAVSRGGVADRVTFLGFTDRDTYRDVLAATDLFLQPSLTAPNGDSEGGAPTTLLDAQALGRVIVASDHADIPFVVDPDAAYLFSEGDPAALADAVTRALGSQAEWRERSELGRRHVEAQHGPAAVARRRDEIYAEAAEFRP